MRDAKYISCESGQTIVEAIVVIGIVVILSTGLIAGTTASLHSVRSSRIRSEAAKYAQEGLELMRTLRDENWTNFQNHNGNYCLGSDNILVSSALCESNITTPESTYTRSIQFSWLANKMQVTSTVDYPWVSTKRTVTLSTYFTQWK
jgi:type II secretory pathway pseudopilin PulG